MKKLIVALALASAFCLALAGCSACAGAEPSLQREPGKRDHQAPRRPVRIRLALHDAGEVAGIGQAFQVLARGRIGNLVAFLLLSDE